MAQALSYTSFAMLRAIGQLELNQAQVGRAQPDLDAGVSQFPILTFKVREVEFSLFQWSKIFGTEVQRPPSI